MTVRTKFGVRFVRDWFILNAKLRGALAHGFHMRRKRGRVNLRNELQCNRRKRRRMRTRNVARRFFVIFHATSTACISYMYIYLE